MEGHRRIVLYDGVCGLCDRYVQALLAVDREGVLSYAPLQGGTAAGLRAQHPEIPADLDTIVFVEDGRVWTRSAALLRIAGALRFPWSLARVGWIVPRPIRDALYRAVARSRYQIFGRSDACRLPRADEAARFLP